MRRPQPWSTPRIGSAFVLLLLLLPLGCENPTPQTAPPTSATSLAANGKTVTLVIDYGDGVEKHFPKLAWHEGMTVLDAMRLTSNHPHGLHFATWSNQTGQAALVEEIDGVKNEGSQTDAKNWTYKINGKKAQLGAGIQPLDEGDLVVWKFGVYEVE